MTGDRYAKFLPPRYRAAISPSSSMWAWRDCRIHIATATAANAPFRLLAIHGAGGHSGALWPFAALAAERGAEVVFPDMPLYGRTEVPAPNTVRYADWIDMLCDLVVAERARDPRPLVLFGASMGGMLAYEVAARTGEVADVIATCLLDPSDATARSHAARYGPVGRHAPALLKFAVPVFGNVRVPVRWLMDIGKMSLDPELSRTCADDPLGGGVSVPLSFLASFLSFDHRAPEEYAGPKVTLVHPAADTWTPPESSIAFLRRIPVPTALVMLDGCGHFPIEEPGLSQLVATMEDIARSHGWAP